MTLDSYRRRRGESVSAFAKRAGISEATYWRIKKHGARSGAVIEKIVAACEGRVSANDLVVGGKRQRVA